MKPDELDCEQALQQLFDYLDHELAPAEREAMQHHLDTCRSCYSRADFEGRLKARMAGLREEQPSATATDRIRRLLDGL